MSLCPYQAWQSSSLHYVTKQQGGADNPCCFHNYDDVDECKIDDHFFTYLVNLTSFINIYKPHRVVNCF